MRLWAIWTGVEFAPDTIDTASFAIDIVGNVFSLILFKKVIDHFESGNFGATWTSAALVMFVPWLFDWCLEFTVALLPDAVFNNQVFAIPLGLSMAVVRLAIGVALVKWRYRQEWLYSFVLYVGAWILSGLIGIIVGAPLLLLFSLISP